MEIGITGWGSVSALGFDKKQIWENYLTNNHHFTKESINGNEEWMAKLDQNSYANVYQLIEERNAYKNIDASVLYAIFTARDAVKSSNHSINSDLGINIGSSRGATGLFENYHAQFINSTAHETYPQASPSTTLGNIASWVATDLNPTDGSIRAVTSSTNIC